jgi:hypothetical protein
MFGLIILCIWQYIAFNTYGNPVITPKDVYWMTTHQLIALEVLTII